MDIGETDNGGCLTCSDFGHWEHNVQRSDRECEASSHDRDRGDKNTREISNRIFHLAYNEPDLDRN